MARKKSVDKRREINGVIFLAIAVILGVAFYLPPARSGWLGMVVQSGGFGLFGAVSYALPVLALYMAIDYLLEKNSILTHRRFTAVVILFISVAALFHLLSTDLNAIRLKTIDQPRPAWQAIRLLWQSGQDPQIVESGQRTFSGGLLGGGAALGFHAVAGTVGSIILTIALIISLMILLFNVSPSRLFGHTADAIKTTGQKMDQAVRDRVTEMRTAQDTVDPKSFDLQLKTEPSDKESGHSEGSQASQDHPLNEHRPTLLESLKKLFQPNYVDELPTLSEAELSVPPFLDAGQEKNTAKHVEQTGEQAIRSLSQTSPFNVTVSSPRDGTDDHVVLPAGVHRVSAPADTVAKHEDPVSGSREHWTDRTEPISDTEHSAKRIPAAPGTQLSLDLPYQAPPLRLLRHEIPQSGPNRNSSVKALGLKLEQTLESFGIQAHVVHVTTGPTITRFELSPGPGVKVSRIVSLSDDIALSLAALGVRIEAPIPGKSAIGIEIPNKETQPVLLRSLLESPEFQSSTSPLAAALGRDIQGSPILCDIAKMPHLLIAGATGSGKSVCINAILMSILFRSSPDNVKMLMIDPKVVELSVYNGIPHLLAPVVTDPKKAANTLNWAVQEMVRRYGLFAEKSVRDFNSYRASSVASKSSGQPEEDENNQTDADVYEHLPLILLVIDELSDLMATSPTEVEDSIARLTAMARAAGIHLIIATQRPSVDVITGVIKANIPSRIAFAVASQVDSRTILDTGGAEKLLGKGDLLYYPQSATKPVRGQGAFVTDSEVEQVLNYIKNQHAADYDSTVSDAIMTAQSSQTGKTKEDIQDELVPQALEIVVQTGYASVSLLQRRLNVGYPRAARLIDALHDQGYIGPFEGSKPRKLLITQTQYESLKTGEKN